MTASAPPPQDQQAQDGPRHQEAQESPPIIIYNSCDWFPAWICQTQKWWKIHPCKRLILTHTCAGASNFREKSIICQTYFKGWWSDKVKLGDLLCINLVFNISFVMKMTHPSGIFWKFIRFGSLTLKCVKFAPSTSWEWEINGLGQVYDSFQTYLRK